MFSRVASMVRFCVSCSRPMTMGQSSIGMVIAVLTTSTNVSLALRGTPRRRAIASALRGLRRAISINRSSRKTVRGGRSCVAALSSRQEKRSRAMANSRRESPPRPLSFRQRSTSGWFSMARLTNRSNSSSAHSVRLSLTSRLLSQV